MSGVHSLLEDTRVLLTLPNMSGGHDNWKSFHCFHTITKRGMHVYQSPLSLSSSSSSSSPSSASPPVKKRYCKPLIDNSMTQLRSVTCHMGLRSVTCYPTQVNTPHINPSQTAWYSIYRPFKGGWLSKPRPMVQRATGPLFLRDSPEPSRPEPTTQR